MRLNGWQRLWIVFAVLVGVSFVLEAVKRFPGEATARRNARYEVLAAYGSSDLPRLVACMEKAGDLNHNLDNPTYQRCDEQSRGMTEQDSLKAYRRMEEVLPQRRDDVTSRQFELIGGYVVGWLAIIAVAYGLGWTVAWVRRGFRSPTDR